MLARDVHQLLDFIVAEEGRRSAAPVQLLHDTRAVEKLSLHGDLAMQAAEVRRSPLAVLGHDLVAGTIKTNGVAEREVEKKQKRTRGRRLVGAFRPRAIIRFVEIGVELHCRRIRGITWSALVVTAKQFGIKNYLMIQA